MTGIEAIAYIENYTWSTTRLGLERTRELLAALGDPQKNLKFVHVAGSNGKGSTCAMLASVLERAGYRTGLYTSPYIEEFCERMQINGENIPHARLGEITERVREIADAMSDHPSQFELVTAIALQYFKEARCDIVVLEVGMGGALDSTNVIDAPEVAVITAIALEHTEYLGDTIEKIARTKAGIIKPGCSAVCYDGDPAVVKAIADTCHKLVVPLCVADFEKIIPLSHDLSGQKFAWKDREYKIPPLGEHQLRNAAVVLEVISALRQRGWQIDENAVNSGLAAVKWPARFEVMSLDPLFIVDGGHNPQCAEAMAQLLRDYLPEQKCTFIMGVLGDKDYERMLKSVMPFAGKVYCLTPDSPRAMGAQELSDFIEARFDVSAEAEKSPTAAIEKALSFGAPVVAFGSLYMSGAMRRAFISLLKARQRTVYLEARKSLPTHLRRDAAEAISKFIVELPELRSAKAVLSYIPCGSEVDITGLNKELLAQGKILAFPLPSDDDYMDAAVPAEDEGWQCANLGVPCPDGRTAAIIPPEDIDAVLVPCLAFDGAKNRLGRGGGYYDRYLARCKNAVTVAIAFECQRAKAVVHEKHDMTVGLVVTENGVRR